MYKTVKPKYQAKHVEMLTAVQVIIQNAIKDKQILSLSQTNWTGTYLEDLLVEIQNKFDLLGAKPIEDQKRISKALFAMQSDALLKFRIFEPVLREMYPEKEADEFIAKLGYKYRKRANNGDQEALINWLVEFDTHLSLTEEQNLVAQGMSQSMISDLRLYRKDFPNLNSEQEQAKQVTVVLNAEIRKELNLLYERVSKIADIAKAVFHDEVERRRGYSFYRIVRNMNYQQASSDSVDSQQGQQQDVDS